MILVKTFYAHNELRNYSYLIVDQKTGRSWVIDPYEPGPIANYIKKNGIKLEGILNTHQHFDHIRGNETLRNIFRSPVRKLKSSDTLQLSDSYCLETLGTPGHTMDHQVFIWKENQRPMALFSGDTLFNSGVGNCRGGGDVNLLFETTQKLLNSLPESTLLYPGHDYRKKNLEFAFSVEPENSAVAQDLKRVAGVHTEELAPSTLGDEKRVNPFLRLDSPELRQNLLPKSDALHENPENERELFIKLRKLRDQW